MFSIAREPLNRVGNGITRVFRLIPEPVRNVIHDPRVVPFILLAPFLILFAIFKVYPTVLAVVMSFSEIQGLDLTGFVGTENYEAAFRDQRFGQAFRQTSIYTVATLLLLIPLPMIIAALLYSGRVQASIIWRTIIFLPALTSLVVVGTVFKLILDTDGLLNSALGIFGAPEYRWIEVRDLIIPSLVIMAVWRWTGINVIYFNSGLINIPDELYEAADIDGANAVQKFWYITVPLLRPITIFVTFLTIIGGFQLFVEPFVLFSGGRSPGDGGLTIALLIYQKAFTSFQFGPAAAMGTVLAVVILIFSALQFKLMGVFDEEDE